MIEIFKYYIPSRDFQFPKEPYGYRIIVRFGKYSYSKCFISLQEAFKKGQEKLDFLEKKSDI